MNKEELAIWIEKLTAETDGKKRNTIVGELCKEKGIKIGEAWRFLKEAGFNPKAAADNTEGTETNDAPENTCAPQADAEAEASAAKIETEIPAENKTPIPENQNPKKIPVMVSHKTGYEKYRCAGLVLTSKPQNYLVTEEQAEKLKRDPWVVVSK